LGLSAATIQRPTITQKQVSTLFWINTAFGLGLAGLLVLVAPLIADFYNEPELTAVTTWLAAGFALSGPAIQHWALLRRQMRFGAIAMIETGAEVAGMALAIGLALDGWSYWALVAQRLAVPGLTLVATWLLCPWRPGLPARDADLQGFVHFGASVTGFNLLTAAARSLDQVLIGWLWGPAVLGFYERAAKLVLVPVNNINAPIYAVAMPVLSRLDGQPERYRSAFLLMLEKFAMVTMPPAAVAMVTADWVVALLFGPQWHDATIYVACFAAAAVTLPTTLAVGLLYQSQNRPGDLLRAALADAALVALAVLVGLSYGAVGIAVAYGASGLCLRLPVAFWLSGRRGPVRTADMVRAILPALTAAIVTAAVIGLLRFEGLLGSASALGNLAIAALISCLVILTCFLAIPRSRRALGFLWHLPRLVRQQGPASSRIS
jgi:polysaccharide transporter, PST family